MERETCYRCELLAGAVLSAVTRHVNLVGQHRVAQMRLEVELVTVLDSQIALAAHERDEAFRLYLAHCQSEAHAFKPGTAPGSLLPSPASS
jgi:hypothetical protein